MQIIRHYFISNNLDELEQLETQLESSGFSKAQVHVLSLDDTSVEQHKRLHDVTSVMKTDVLRSGEIGAGIGLALAALVLLVAYFAGWTAGALGWLPYIFLALIIVGFATWEGGFIGIQRTNTHFKRFEKALQDGNHVFFVDLEPGQEAVLERCLKQFASISLAGTEKGTPHWVLKGQQRIPEMIQNI